MQRNLYFDTLRGIAILMVIAIHTFYACEFDSIMNICVIAIREVFNSAVPFFLAISGFFIGKKNYEDKEQIFSLWNKQILKVYIPAMVWSVPYFVLAIYRGQSILQNILLFLFCGYSIYYFIALIIQCYLLLPVVQRKMLNILSGVAIFLYINDMCFSDFIYWNCEIPVNCFCRSCYRLANILLAGSLSVKE